MMRSEQENTMARGEEHYIWYREHGREGITLTENSLDPQRNPSGLTMAS